MSDENTAITTERNQLEPKIKELKKVALEQFKNYPELIKHGHVAAMQAIAKENNHEALFNTWKDVLNKIITLSENIKTKSNTADIWELKEVECAAEELLQNDNHKLLVDFYFYSRQLEHALGADAVFNIFHSKTSASGISDFSSEYIKAIQWLPRFPLFFEGKPLPQEDELLKAKFSHFNSVFKKIAKDINEYQRDMESFVINGMSITRFAEEAKTIPSLIEGLTFEEFISLFPEGAGVIPTELLQQKAMEYTKLLKSTVTPEDLNMILTKMAETNPSMQIKVELGEPLNKMLEVNLRDRKLSVHKLVEIKKAFIKLKTEAGQNNNFIKLLEKSGVKLQESDKARLKSIQVEPAIAKLKTKMHMGSGKKMQAASHQDFDNFEYAWKEAKGQLDGIVKLFPTKPVVIKYVSQLLEATHSQSIRNSIEHDERLHAVEKLKLQQLSQALIKTQQAFEHVKEIMEVGKQDGKYKNTEAEEMTLLAAAARAGNPLVFLSIKEILPNYAGKSEQLITFVSEINLAMQGVTTLNLETFKGKFQGMFSAHRSGDDVNPQVSAAIAKISAEYDRQNLIRQIQDEVVNYNLRQILSANPHIQLTDTKIQAINVELENLKNFKINMERFNKNFVEHVGWAIISSELNVLCNVLHTGHQQYLRGCLHNDLGYQKVLNVTTSVDGQLKLLQKSFERLGKLFKKDNLENLLVDQTQNINKLYQSVTEANNTLEILRHLDKTNFAAAMQCKESKASFHNKTWHSMFKTVTACRTKLEQNCLKNLQGVTNKLEDDLEKINKKINKATAKGKVELLNDLLAQTRSLQNRVEDLHKNLNQLPVWYDQKSYVSLQVTKANLMQLHTQGNNTVLDVQRRLRDLAAKGVVQERSGLKEAIKSLFSSKSKVKTSPSETVMDLYAIDKLDNTKLSEKEQVLKNAIGGRPSL